MDKENLLCNIPLNQLKPNMRVRSIITGTLGTITAISGVIEREDYSISIDWDNGNFSHVWHFWLSNVELVNE